MRVKTFSFILQRFSSTNIKQLTNNKMNFHQDILSSQEIYHAVQQVITTPDQQFLLQLKQGNISATIWAEISKKQNMKMLSTGQQIKILKALQNFQQSQQEPEMILLRQNHTALYDKIYSAFLQSLKNKLSDLSLKEIAQILKLFAFVNRFDQSFFREVENEIYERLHNQKQLLTIGDAQKILQAYQKSHFGSAILLKDLATVFKIAQFEISPLKLSEYCYQLAKCKDNLKGGFGLYKIAQERTLSQIQDFDFHTLTKIAKYFYVINIGSNEFQIKLEEKLCELFPNGKDIFPADLISLLKTTSKYIFRYNSKALYHKIESTSIQLMPFFNNKQFCHMLWSFMRSQRGNLSFYIQAEQQLRERIQTFTSRQLVQLYKNSINQFEAEDINEILIYHIKTKFQADSKFFICFELVTILVGLIKQDKEQELQSLLIQKLSEQQLTSSTNINLIDAIISTNLNENTLTLIKLILKNPIEKNSKNEIEELMRAYGRRICQRYFTNQEANFKDSELKKQYFYQQFHLNPFGDSYLSVLDYLCEQHQDDMRFIFKQDHWVTIAWNILTNHIIYNISIKTRLLDQAQAGIKEMDPNLLENLSLIKYTQALALVAYLGKWETTQIYRKLSRLTKRKTTSIIHNNVHLQNVDLIDEQFLNDIKEHLVLNVKKQIPQELIAKENQFINMFEQTCQQLLPVVYLVELVDKQILKFCIIPLTSQYDFQEKMNITDESLYNNKIQPYREYLVLKFILEKVYNWNTEFIVKETWQQQSSNKSELIEKIFNLQIDLLKDTPQKERQRLRSRRRTLQSPYPQEYLESVESSSEDL